MMKRWQYLIPIYIFSATSLFAEEESVTYCVENYGSTNECGGTDIPDACDVAAQWDIGLDDQTGLWAQVEDHTNQGVDSTDFLDPGADVDPTGIDFADVGLFVGVGGRHSCTDAFLVPGDSGGSCSINVASMVSDVDLDMMSLFASNSAHKCIAAPGVPLEGQCVSGAAGTGTGYSPIPRNNELKLINGFHGNTYIKTDDHFIFLSPSDMRSYVDVSELNGWGENWINFFADFPDGSVSNNRDRCPTSIVFAGNQSEVQAIWEAGGFKDRDNGGAFTTCRGFAFISTCDPADGEVL